MAADASIYAQFRRPVRSMAEYAADYDVAEGNALKLAAARLDAQKAQRAMADEDAIRGLARQHGGDENALIRAFRTGGYFDKAAGLEKSIGERLKAKSDQAKIDAETELKRFEVAEKRSRAFEDARAALEADPGLTRDKVLGVLQGMVERDLMPLQLAQRMAQGLPEDPNLLRDDIRRGNLSRLSAKDRIELFTPKTEWKDSGQQLIPVQTNPNAPGYTAPTPIQKVQTPDSVASNARMVEEGRLNRGVTMRGQNLADARARDQLTLETGGPSQAGLAKQLGKAPPGYRWKPDGGLESIPGGPADIKAGEAGAKASAKRDAQIAQAEGVLGTISDAKKLTGYTTAGVGGVLARVPATDARNLQSKLETVKANLGFDRLQQMRDNSPTGGALGAVAVQELIALQSTVASLDQLQSPKELGAALEKIERHYTRWLDVMKQAPGGGEGGASGGWEAKTPKTGPVDFGSLK